jgi:hypothetical protein
VEGVLFEIPLVAELPDLEALRLARTPGEKGVAIGRHENLQEHLEHVCKEFAGEPQIDFYHAALTVLIRRRIQGELAQQHFERVWSEQSDHLLSSLSARWLVSACDTIMDCSADPVERAMACAASNLMNTIKLYETERLANGPSRTSLESLATPVPLFDGMTSFSVGWGDMILNLRKRTEAICSGNTTASKILRELLRRADRADTIYRRLAQVHVIDDTRWTQVGALSRTK